MGVGVWGSLRRGHSCTFYGGEAQGPRLLKQADHLGRRGQGQLWARCSVWPVVCRAGCRPEGLGVPSRRWQSSAFPSVLSVPIEWIPEVEEVVPSVETVGGNSPGKLKCICRVPGTVLGSGGYWETGHVAALRGRAFTEGQSFGPAKMKLAAVRPRSPGAGRNAELHSVQSPLRKVPETWPCDETARDLRL